MTQSMWWNERSSLYQLVSDSQEEIEPNEFYVNGYDRPTKFWNRRNEVWLVKKD